MFNRLLLLDFIFPFPKSLIPFKPYFSLSFIYLFLVNIEILLEIKIGIHLGDRVKQTPYASAQQKKATDGAIFKNTKTGGSLRAAHLSKAISRYVALPNSG